MTMHRLWIHGCTGRTGSLIYDRFRSTPSKVVEFCGGSNSEFLIDAETNRTPYKNANELAAHFNKSKISAIIDFSTPAANQVLFDAVRDSSTVNAVLIGTTGLSADAVNRWQDFAKSKSARVLIAPNTSLGVLAMAQAARVMRQALKTADFDIELVETHHRQKLDAPGGTAKYLAQVVATACKDALLSIVNMRDGKRKNGELGVHAVRGGHVAGKHEIFFFGEYEELTLSHNAYDRKLFAIGSQTLLHWLIEQKSGLYSLDDVSFAAKI